MEPHGLVEIICHESSIFEHRLELFLVKDDSNLEEHLDCKQPHDCAGGFSRSAPPNHHHIPVLAYHILLFLSQCYPEIGYLLQ